MCFSLTADMSAEALSLEPLVSTKAIFTHICVSCQTGDSLLCLASKCFFHISNFHEAKQSFEAEKVTYFSSGCILKIFTECSAFKKRTLPHVSDAF